MRMNEEREVNEASWRVAVQDDGRIVVWVANDGRPADKTSYAALLTPDEARELAGTLRLAARTSTGQAPATVRSLDDAYDV